MNFDQQDYIMRRIFDQPPLVTDYICNWSKKFRYVYVETPKVACTTVKRVLQQAEAGGGLVWEDPSFIHDRRSSPLLSPRSDMVTFSEAMESPDYFRFCFVRNPFTRSLSCWLDKIVKNEWERRRLAPLLGLNEDEPSSFVDFLRAVSHQCEENCDPHWSTQTFLVRPNRVRYSFIGRFELFRDHFRMVCARLGIEDYVDDLPDTWHATNAYSKVKEHFGPVEIDLVHKIYERDFRNFGYGWSPEVI